MSIKSQITRIQNAKNDILKVITEKGVAIPSGVLLNDVANLVKQIADKNLTSEIDDGTKDYLYVKLDGETNNNTCLSLTFN